MKQGRKRTATRHFHGVSRPQRPMPLAIFMKFRGPRGPWRQLRKKRYQTDVGGTLRGIVFALNQWSYGTRRGTAWRLESVAGVLKQAATRTERYQRLQSG